MDTAACCSGQPGCASAENKDIAVLLQALQSPVVAVREAALMVSLSTLLAPPTSSLSCLAPWCSQALNELQLCLPTPDVDFDEGLNLVRRVWIARFDVEEDNRKLAEKSVSQLSLSLRSSL